MYVIKEIIIRYICNRWIFFAKKIIFPSKLNMNDGIIHLKGVHIIIPVIPVDRINTGIIQCFKISFGLRYPRDKIGSRIYNLKTVMKIIEDNKMRFEIIWIIKIETVGIYPILWTDESKKDLFAIKIPVKIINPILINLTIR